MLFFTLDGRLGRPRAKFSGNFPRPRAKFPGSFPENLRTPKKNLGFSWPGPGRGARFVVYHDPPGCPSEPSILQTVQLPLEGTETDAYFNREVDEERTVL